MDVTGTPYLCPRTKAACAQCARKSSSCAHTRTGSARESAHVRELGANRAQSFAEVPLVRAHQGQFGAPRIEPRYVVDHQRGLDAESASNPATWASSRPETASNPAAWSTTKALSVQPAPNPPAWSTTRRGSANDTPGFPYARPRTKATCAQRARKSSSCAHTRTGSARESAHVRELGANRVQSFAEVPLVRAHQGQFGAPRIEPRYVVDHQRGLDAESASNSVFDSL
jgi:hypothetical protein